MIKKYFCVAAWPIRAKWGLLKNLFYSIVLFFGPGASAQVSSTELLAQQFVSYSQNAIQEKIFVHTDKDFYLAGQILWFKLYTVDGYFHQLLNVSKVGYVEILDLSNRAVLQGKIALTNGDGNGSFFLPLTLTSGNYKFRAYTNWMKNFSPEFYFEKAVTIVNTKLSYQPPSEVKAPVYDIQFLPEGGNLVHNIESRVAFRVTDQNGRGVQCRGIVISNRHDTIAKFEPLKFGIGSFLLTPLPDESYKAVITFPEGNFISKDLPTALSDGYAMRLTHKAGQIKVAVRSKQVGRVFLLIHTRGVIKSIQTASIENGVAQFTLSADSLGDGISQFTAFNNERQPVSERLYFKYPRQKLQLNIQTDKPVYPARKKISLDITTENEAGKASAATMSMAVYRVDSLQVIDATNISSYLWLVSDLPGIESPEYYFSTSDSTTGETMDNLMLTYGWRRFKWKDVTENRKPVFEFAPEFNGHVINGKSVDSKTGLAVPNMNGFLSVPGTMTSFRNAVSDSTGRIKFEMKNFYGGSEIIVQTNPLEDSLYRIEISNPFSASYSSLKIPSFSLREKNYETLLDQSINTQVQYVFAAKRERNFRMPQIDTTPFYLKPDINYQLDNYTRFTTMEEVLREYVQPVYVGRQGGRFRLHVVNLATKNTFEKDPFVLLDGVPVFNMNKLMDYDPLKVKSLEVVSRRYFLGNSAFDGIVNLFTYNGNLEGYELDANAIVLDYEGLQLQREFYSPVYQSLEQRASHLPDFRTLLYWSPDVRTSVDGKGKIEFYSSDLSGKYAIVLQGISADGRTGNKTVVFEVK